MTYNIPSAFLRQATKSHAALFARTVLTSGILHLVGQARIEHQEAVRQAAMPSQDAISML
jgi:hypothetical protein